jgi:hypothetical protein
MVYFFNAMYIRKLGDVEPTDRTQSLNLFYKVIQYVMQPSVNSL